MSLDPPTCTIQVHVCNLFRRVYQKTTTLEAQWIPPNLSKNLATRFIGQKSSSQSFQLLFPDSWIQMDCKAGVKSDILWSESIVSYTVFRLSGVFLGFWWVFVFSFLPSYDWRFGQIVIWKDHWQSDKRKSPGSSPLNTCTCVSPCYMSEVGHLAVFLGHLALNMPKSLPCSYFLL